MSAHVKIHPTARHYRAQMNLARKLGLTWVETPGVGLNPEVPEDGINGHWVTDDETLADLMGVAEARIERSLPVDWNEWRAEWKEQRPTLPITETYPIPAGLFPGKNPIADECLGIYLTDTGRWVELSEVTFPALGQRPHRDIRYVGISWGPTSLGEADLASSWDELRTMLGAR